MRVSQAHDGGRLLLVFGLGALIGVACTLLISSLPGRPDGMVLAPYAKLTPQSNGVVARRTCSSQNGDCGLEESTICGRDG